MPPGGSRRSPGFPFRKARQSSGFLNCSWRRSTARTPLPVRTSSPCCLSASSTSPGTAARHVLRRGYPDTGGISRAAGFPRQGWSPPWATDRRRGSCARGPRPAPPSSPVRPPSPACGSRCRILVVLHDAGRLPPRRHLGEHAGRAAPLRLRPSASVRVAVVSSPVEADGVPGQGCRPCRTSAPRAGW